MRYVFFCFVGAQRKWILAITLAWLSLNLECYNAEYIQNPPKSSEVLYPWKQL